ncbi:MAG: GNAT family N-acetyltransferase [Ruegeria sp.]
MGTIQFREARQADAGAITTCIAAAYAEARESIPDLPDVTAGIEEEIEVSQVVLAETGRGLAGVIVFARRGDAMKIVNLAVSPDAQGQGIAGRLMAWAEEEARASGCTRMELRTHRLMEGTRAMYTHLGWRETETSGNTVSMMKAL